MDLMNIFKNFFGPSNFNNFERFGNFDSFDDDDSEGNSFSPFSFIQTMDDLLQQQFFNEFDNSQDILNSQSVIQQNSNNLRQLMLKPGFQNTLQARPNADIDLDDKKDELRNLNDFSSRKPNGNMKEPFFRMKSVITRRIRQPDGTYVTEKITKDESGKEERTIIYSKDDKNDDPKAPFNDFL